ncbi:MAG TPA: RNA methyltransferase, partial [Deltaproteobacteria bacterium]|nr:RNA methyltransferase [Deltaproteobacteria bacterium]
MLSIALVHWPCLDKNGDVIATAITNLDLHDGARVCLTYGINTLYIVHPYQSQRDFAARIMDHWLTGFGGEYNPLRKRAFEVVRVIDDLAALRAQSAATVVATSARRIDGAISWAELRGLDAQGDVCLLFGTGWGLAPQALAQADAVVEPIAGRGDFNHLLPPKTLSIAMAMAART